MKSNDHEDGRTGSIRRASWTGIAAGVLAILVCELPIILAALGFAGLSAGARNLRLPALAEIIAIAIGLLGVFTLVSFAAVKFVNRQKETK